MHLLLDAGVTKLLEMVTFGHMIQLRKQAHTSMCWEKRGQRMKKQTLGATAFGCCINLALWLRTQDPKARKEWTGGAVECERISHVRVWLHRVRWPIRNSARGHQKYLCRQVARQKIGTWEAEHGH
jgi:hypothetical protein